MEVTKRKGGGREGRKTTSTPILKGIKNKTPT